MQSVKLTWWDDFRADWSDTCIDGYRERRDSVLVVDDDECIRQLLAELIEDAGFAVLQAGSGAGALAMIEAGVAVDVIVTDLLMPAVDGVALVRGARSVLPGLPVIVVTGAAVSDDDLRETLNREGSIAVLRKPVRSRDVIETLNAMLTGTRTSAALR